jgi:hypothetical protein
MAQMPQLSQLCDVGCFIMLPNPITWPDALLQIYQQAVASPVIHAIDVKNVNKPMWSEMEPVLEQHHTLGGNSYTASPVLNTWLWVIIFNVIGCAPAAPHELMPGGMTKWVANRIAFSPGCTTSTLDLDCAECACEATHADGQATRRWECVHARPCSYAVIGMETVNTTAAAEACMPRVQVWHQHEDATTSGVVVEAEADLRDLRDTSRTSNVTLQQLMEDMGYCVRVWCTVNACSAWYGLLVPENKIPNPTLFARRSSLCVRSGPLHTSFSLH